MGSGDMYAPLSFEVVGSVRKNDHLTYEFIGSEPMDDDLTY